MPQSIYTRPRIMHSCGLIPEIQAGLETIWTLTSYADGSNAENCRVQLSLSWRFYPITAIAHITSTGPS